MKHRNGGTLRLGVVATLLAALMLIAGPAFAHVTVSTDNPSAGAFAVYTVRVPNESDTASTTKVEVRMPDGLEASRYQPKPGWNITLEDGVLTAEGGQIAPGQFEDFRFQARNPEAPTELAFPAVQTYDDGEVVEWIGEPDSETPASVVEIAPADAGGDGQTEPAAPGGDEPAAAGDDTALTSAAGGPTAPLVYAALALGAIGVLAGGGALWRTQRAA